MNDLERDVREMFRRHEADLPASVPPPAGLVGRVRRRQSTFVSKVVVATAALVALGVGLSSLSTPNHRTPVAPTPRELPLSPDRTAPSLHAVTLGNLRVTVPDGWFLSASGTEAGDTPQPRLGPVVWLSNFAPPLTDDDPCTGMGADGAILVIDPATGDRKVPAWPVDLSPASDPRLRCGSSELDASWAWNGHGAAAMAAFGRSVSDADRRALEDAFASLSPVPGEQPIDPSAYCPATGINASQIVAAGSLQGHPWTAQVSPTCPGIGVAFGGSQVTIARPMSEGLAHPESIHGAVTTTRDATFVFGVAPNDAARVVVDPVGAPRVTVTLAPLGNIQAFAAAVRGLRRGTITAFDANGAVLATSQFSFKKSSTSI